MPAFFFERAFNEKIAVGIYVDRADVVIAVIGIIAAIAIPQYQDYVTRTRWADSFVSVAQLQTAVADCMQNNRQPSPPVNPCDAMGVGVGTVTT